MDRRLILHSKLEAISGVEKVYYQPPESIKLKYPCIVYNLRNIDMTYADNLNYRAERGYDITLIHQDPDTPIIDRMIDALPTCRFDRHYVVDNLYHDSFVLYF